MNSSGKNISPLFDRAFIMDSLSLSGRALCELTDRVAGRPCSQHVTTLDQLMKAVLRHTGERLFIITELMSERERLADCLKLLAALRPRQAADRCRVMVCTDLSDPLVLRAVSNLQPAAIALRRESLEILTQSMRMAWISWPNTVLSPAVTDGFMLARDIHLTPRELEWLVTQADGMDLRGSAKAMRVSYKTVSTWRRNISRRLSTATGDSKPFTLRLAELQKSTGILFGAGED